MKNFLIGLVLFSNLLVSAQVKGVVKDATNGLPIPYVSIWVENENFATTAEENGEFAINVSAKSKNLVFSSLGYERKIIPIPDASIVQLSPSAVALDEVVISKRKETRRNEIGFTKNNMREAFDNAPRFDLKFFPYQKEYKKTPYLKQVCVVTDSKIDGASFKLHLYRVDENGHPGAEMLDKDFIVSVDKGILKTKFNLTKYNLAMPKEGIFVGFEKLMIAKNRFRKDVADANTNSMQAEITYHPFLLYESVRRDRQFVYAQGQWTVKTNQTPEDPKAQIRIYEPAITLILTN